MKRPVAGGPLCQARGAPSFVLWRRASPALTALLLAALLGCVTALPRPGAEVTPTPQAATPSPAVPFTPVQEPTATPKPTYTPEPTETPTPTPTPTQIPSPTPTPSSADIPEGLILAVYAPEDGAVVPGSSVVVYGQTEPGVKVLISGVEAEVDSQGGFRANVPLQPGENLVEIAAATGNSESSRILRRVTSLALPFLLLITEPENESIVSNSRLTLSGRTGPNAIVSINGSTAPVDRYGYFSEIMTLVEGPNFIDVVATNDDGKTHSEVVAVIYRPASE